MGAAHTRQRLARFRPEQHRELAVAGHKGLDRDGEQSARGMRDPVHRPVGAQRQEQPIRKGRNPGISRFVELDPRAVAQQQGFVRVKCDAADDELVGVPPVMNHGRSHPHIGRFAGKHGLGLVQRRAAAPGLYHPRIAGVRQGSRPEIGSNIKRVGIAPGDRAFGLGQGEPVRHETLADEIELADDGGVGAPAGEVEQAAFVLGIERGHALVDPVLLLGLRQVVEV